MGIMNTFMAIVIMQLFFSVAINIVTYTTPESALNYVTAFSGDTGSLDLESTSNTVQNSLDQQTNLPLVDVGALVFYSGNIILDLMLNFALAIPQMVTLLINGILMIFAVDTYLLNYLQLFFSVVIAVWYFISIISFLAGIRSGRVIE
jgi:hypothetical protein